MHENQMKLNEHPILSTPFHLENSCPSFSFTRLDVAPFACDIPKKQEARCDGWWEDIRRVVFDETSGIVGLIWLKYNNSILTIQKA